MHPVTVTIPASFLSCVSAAVIAEQNKLLDLARADADMSRSEELRRKYNEGEALVALLNNRKPSQLTRAEWDDAVAFAIV